MRMDVAARVAHFITHRRRWLHAAVAALAVASGLTIVFGVRFASDVLDLLPQHFESVRIFKTYDREFSQARELTFGLLDESGEADLDAFAEHFADALRGEPWVVRVMDRSPMESPAGIAEVQAIAVPLLLNLPPADFDAALSALEPAAIDARIARLRAEMEAGSPKAEFQLDFDPLGLVAPALKPLAGSFSVEQTRPLASPDGTLRVVVAVTDQPDLGAKTSQAMMARVADFKARVLASWDGEKKPEILVTGRTPYVGELSIKMRTDVLSTLGSSLVLVALVFWLGFRRVRPLLAMAHVLMLCCLAAVALGALFFRELNMITIGLCAILVGLGIDYGMMLFGIYQAERDAGHSHEEAVTQALRHHGSGVIFGSLTTAAAFLCLLRSDCTGFEQLGVLIALGILLAGGLMMTVFFAYMGKKHKPLARDPLHASGHRLVAFIFQRPRAVFLAGGAVLAALSALVIAPVGRLRLEPNPRSLEPANSQAGRALAIIKEKMPAANEPVLVLVRGRDAQELHDRWARLHAAWTPLIAEGRVKGAATPAAFAISPARVKANAARLAEASLSSARATLAQALTREGLNAESFAPAFALLDTLAGIARGEPPPLDWRQLLPATSSWLFVLDRFFGRDPQVTVGYITPAQPLSSFAEKDRFQKMMTVPSVESPFSGWTYTLADLIPWAAGKLRELTAIMIVFNVLLLTFLFRRAFPVFVLMLSLALSIGALLASVKLLGIPLNLFNALAFALVLGVGVDYGIYIAIAMRAPGDPQRSIATIFKPVLLSGLTTAVGFGSLAWAENPALRGLGAVCAIGVVWCLVSTFFFILPLFAWRGARR